LPTKLRSAPRRRQRRAVTTKLRSAPLRGPATPRLDHEPAQRAAPRRRQRRAVTTNLRSAARRAAGDAAP